MQERGEKAMGPAGGGEHAGMTMGAGVSRPQLAAVTVLTLLLLAAGVLLGALYGDVTMRARDMGAMPGMDHGSMSGMGAAPSATLNSGCKVFASSAINRAPNQSLT